MRMYYLANGGIPPDVHVHEHLLDKRLICMLLCKLNFVYSQLIGISVWTLLQFVFCHAQRNINVKPYIFPLPTRIFYLK